MFGFVAPTKVDENFMSQVLEHILLANGATPVGDGGFTGFDPAKTVEALEFYKGHRRSLAAGANSTGISRARSTSQATRR